MASLSKLNFVGYGDGNLFLLFLSLSITKNFKSYEEFFIEGEMVI